MNESDNKNVENEEVVAEAAEEVSEESTEEVVAEAAEDDKETKEEESSPVVSLNEKHPHKLSVILNQIN